MIRQIDGRQAPQAGTYQIDPSHSTVAAVAKHLVVSKVRGGFSDFSGTIIVGENLSDSSVSVTIQTASIDTNNEDRDNHLRSADFLDADQYPTITFSSNLINTTDDGWTAVGDLTIRGTTGPVEIPFQFLGTFADPWGNNKAIFSGGTQLRREDWGMTWNAPLEAGGVLVGKTLDIELEIQATLEP